MIDFENWIRVWAPVLRRVERRRPFNTREAKVENRSFPFCKNQYDYFICLHGERELKKPAKYEWDSRTKSYVPSSIK